MDCDTVNKFLHAYLDGEFDEREAAELRAHLGHCRECRRVAEQEQRFLTGLRQKLAIIEECPKELVLRVRVAVRHEASRVARRRLVLLLPVPAVLAVALLTIILLPADDSFYPVMEDTVDRHRKNLPLEVASSDERHVSTWFQDKLDFPVRMPQFSAPQVHLVGARLSHIRDHQAAYLTYNVDGRKMSVLVFDGVPMPPSAASAKVMQIRNQRVMLGNIRGYNFAYLKDRGVGYALASDLDQQEILRLVSTAFQQ